MKTLAKTTLGASHPNGSKRRVMPESIIDLLFADAVSGGSFTVYWKVSSSLFQVRSIILIVIVLSNFIYTSFSFLYSVFVDLLHSLLLPELFFIGFVCPILFLSISFILSAIFRSLLFHFQILRFLIILLFVYIFLYLFLRYNNRSLSRPYRNPIFG